MEVIVFKAKSQFCWIGIKIVWYNCHAASRYPDTSKILKILDWSECTDTTLAQIFWGICIDYKIWIKNFALIASPIYHILKKNMFFIWEKEQIKAMKLLKLALTTYTVLISIDFSERTGEIILALDTYQEICGGILMQLVQEKRYLSKYESEIWSVQRKSMMSLNKNIAVF